MEQKEYSKIAFGIRPTQLWDEKTHKYSLEKSRKSDIYVFCVFATKEPELVNPLELSQWEFYVLKTQDINHYLKEQKTVSLNRLKKLPHIKTDYNGLKESVYAAISNITINER